MKTTSKGNIGVAAIMTDLLKKGYEVLIPFSEDSPFDLVVYHDKRFYKIQCKYRALKHGAIIAAFTRMIVNYKKQERRKLKESEIDVIAIYCPDTNKCYYLSYNDIRDKKDRLYLRVSKARNNQTKGTTFAKDYLDEKRAFNIPAHSSVG